MTVNTIVQVLLALAPYLVPPLVALLGLLVTKAVQNLPNAQRQTLSWIVTTAVNSVEQSSGWSSMPSQQKKTLAIQQVDELLSHFHLTVPMSVIDPMVEQAVLLLNMAQGEAKADTPLAVEAPKTVAVTSKEGAL